LPSRCDYNTSAKAGYVYMCTLYQKRLRTRKIIGFFSHIHHVFDMTMFPHQIDKNDGFDSSSQPIHDGHEKDPIQDRIRTRSKGSSPIQRNFQSRERWQPACELAHWKPSKALAEHISHCNRE
jgi:hypothetical protein